MRSTQIQKILLVGLIFTFESFASDLPKSQHRQDLPVATERMLLAEQNTNCAATYAFLYNAAVKNNNPANQEVHLSNVERYVTVSLRLYGDEEKAKVKLDKAGSTLLSQLQKLKDKNTALSILNHRVDGCVQVDAKTIDFVKRSLSNRSKTQ